MDGACTTGNCIFGANRATPDAVEVGEGPTGVVHDGPRDLVYALNKFEGSVSVIDPNARVEVERVAYYDPTPAVIRTSQV